MRICRSWLAPCRGETNSGIEIANRTTSKSLKEFSISFIGTVKIEISAIDNGLQRAAEDSLQLASADVKKPCNEFPAVLRLRRSPGSRPRHVRAPTAALERVGLRALAEEILRKGPEVAGCSYSEFIGLDASRPRRCRFPSLYSCRGQQSRTLYLLPRWTMKALTKALEIAAVTAAGSREYRTIAARRIIGRSRAR